ncbi:TRAP transporter large permease [Cellulomonas xiejunii]|uniref:TRAP transporter large permease n=1 Tax=Cellulomonas xiejunii TaxID=2968083 RepID=A0ABY5KLE7_9CELL|nr:TRAP transporter large permease [Cellulomonas xiejunii]MCC2315806.1 TRAP transporter large permease [Cellulomonas xiejunii]MCC2320847.1 TRAP transporter large permease [Cellulomonas xiejunii]UUI71129.1 TRAP transporter large permease [Cellulomonas xiejunii]
MDPAALAALILLAGIVVFLLLGAPISIAVGLSSLAAIVTALGVENGVLTAAQQVFRGINSFPLLAIPFFVLAGVIMNQGGIALRLVNAAKVMVGRMPGSLAQTNVAANALFGAVSGSGVAAAAAIGSTIGPIQKREGYDKSFAAAVNIASAPSGMIIPPSNLMIVYSLVSSASVAALFVAGYIPGAMWAAACMIIVYLYARKRPELKMTERIGFREGAKTILAAVPALLLIVIVIGGILAGMFTPTEGSVIAVVYSLVLSFFYRTIKTRQIPTMLMDAARTTAVVMFLVGVSSIMGFVMAFAQIPQMASEAIFSVSTNPVVILLLIAVILLILGCFMDPTPAVLIFAPIFLPIVTAMGIHPVHFGIMMVFNLSIGTITPPVGPILFVGAKVADISIEAVIRRLLPFFGALILVLIMVIFTPALSMWLPTQLGLVTP